MIAQKSFTNAPAPKTTKLRFIILKFYCMGLGHYGVIHYLLMGLHNSISIFYIQFDDLKYYSTGWSILFCLILSGSYDNNRILTKKIMVDLFSGYPDISFDNKKSEKNNRHFIS